MEFPSLEKQPEAVRREIAGLLEKHGGFAAQRPFTRMLHRTSVRFGDVARTYAVVGPEFG